MKQFEQYQLPRTPDEAYYNNNIGNSPDIAAEIWKKDKGAFVLSWAARYMHLWDTIIRYVDGIQMIPPPPLVVDRDHEMIGSSNGKEMDLRTTGEMVTSWITGVRDTGDNIAGMVHYQLRVYEKSVLREIEDVAGETPSPFTVRYMVDHLLIHELSHYICTVGLWQRLYTDDSLPHSTIYDELLASLGDMGELDDEAATETLALHIMRILLFGKCGGFLVPKTANSRWARHLSRRYNNEESTLVCAYYELRWKCAFEDHTKAEISAITDDINAIRHRLSKIGKKANIKFKLIP